MYEGSFRADEMDGEGVMTMVDGTVKKGIWSKGVRVRWI